MTNLGKLTQPVDFDRIVVSTLTEAAKTTPLHTTKEGAIPFLASLFGDFVTERISPPINPPLNHFVLQAYALTLVRSVTRDARSKIL